MESSLQSNPVLTCIKALEASITTKLAHVAKAQGDNQLHHHRRIAFIGIGDIGNAAADAVHDRFPEVQVFWTLFMPASPIRLTTFLRYPGGSLSAEVIMNANRWCPCT